MRTILFALAFPIGFLAISALNPVLFTMPWQQFLVSCIVLSSLGIVSEWTMKMP